MHISDWRSDVCSSDLAVGCGRVKKIDIILLDLSLPDSDALAAFDTLHASVPHIPILVFNAMDEALSLVAVESGAYGYLSSDNLENSLIPQVLRSIIHKKKSDQAQYVELDRTRITLQ